MITRIRYTRNPSTGYYFSKPILASTQMVVVTLIPNNMSLTISTVEDAQVLHTETGKNLGDLKRRAKLKLKEMGTPFQDEVRRREDSVTEARFTLGMDDPNEGSN